MITNKTYINVTSAALAFECSLFQPIWRYCDFSKRIQGTNCATFRKCDTKLTTFVDDIDLDESTSIGEEMSENHNSTFASGSSGAHDCALNK